MMRMYGVLMTLLLAACGALPPEKYANPGDPERQLAISSDVNTIDLSAPGAWETVSDAVAHNPPDSAIMGCLPEKGLCKKIASTLSAHKIAVKWGAPEDNVTLVYDHVAEEPCDNSYVDNMSNQANLEHPAFGCSIRTNIVRMASDKKQFVAPAALDKSDAEKAVQNYENYLNPAPAATTSSTSGSGSAASLIGSSAQ